jgi:hypothetical protein
MTNIIEQITIYSENGNKEYPSSLRIKMDGTKPDCPITFYAAGNPVFSLGMHELGEFIEELQKLDIT